GCSYWLLASGESEVESAAFEHDQGDEVAEVPVAVADLDGGLDSEPCVSSGPIFADRAEHGAMTEKRAYESPLTALCEIT
ncbi:MAG: hypothetical protein KH329_10375, partial [Bifidobacterium longum]|nr:hypothetical protein [Bifidobacterium longum]